MEKISFPDLLLSSWQFSRARKIFFVFGFFLALPVAVQSFFLPATDTSAINQWSETFLLHPLIGLLYLSASFIVALFGKGNLIVALENGRRGNDAKRTLSFPSFRSSFLRALTIDASIGFFLIVFLLLLSLPTVVATRTLGSVPESLFTLSLITFIPVAVVLFFIREFTYYYFLLSPLNLTSSAEAAVRFFLRHRPTCLWFGFLVFLFSLLFTFFLNLAMLAIVVLFQKFAPAVPESVVIFGGGLVGFTWYATFRQTLWFTFFQSLAVPKDKKRTDQETGTILEEKVSEIPSV